MSEDIVLLRNYDVYRSCFRFHIENGTAEPFIEKECVNTAGFIKLLGKEELIAFYRYCGELHVNYCERHFLMKDIQSIKILLDCMYSVKMKILLNSGISIIISEKIVTEQFINDFTAFIDDEDFSILRLINNVFKDEERQTEIFNI